METRSYIPHNATLTSLCFTIPALGKCLFNTMPLFCHAQLNVIQLWSPRQSLGKPHVITMIISPPGAIKQWFSKTVHME